MSTNLAEMPTSKVIDLATSAIDWAKANAPQPVVPDKEMLRAIFNEYHTLPYNPASEHYRFEHFYKALLTAGAIYTTPQPVVPQGFNQFAHNRSTGEWFYKTHADEWQSCPSPFHAPHLGVDVNQQLFLAAKELHDYKPAACFACCYSDEELQLWENLGKALLSPRRR